MDRKTAAGQATMLPFFMERNDGGTQDLTRRLSLDQGRMLVLDQVGPLRSSSFRLEEPKL